MPDVVYHVELRQFPHLARAFNLSRDAVQLRFIRPWVAGTIIEHDDRRWVPERTRLIVLEGPALRPDELGLGRGWGSATKSSREVTDALLAAARRGAQARPEVETLASAVTEVAGNPITFQDVMALAGAAQPQWRPSEQLALAEQAVWEMLHQGRLAMLVGDEPVGRERWQPVVLRWATWAGGDEEVFRLQAPASPEPD
ncbi:MAG: hypothetical protein WAL63_09855 [Solirubrobacteraceae bacterium]